MTTEAAVAAISTISAHGTVGTRLRAGTSTAITARLRPSDHQCTEPRWVSRYTSRSKNSAPLVTLMPIILAIWLSRMSVARPPTKPIRIGLDRKSARNPNRNTEQATNIRPPTIAWAAAIAAYCSVPEMATPDSAEPTSAAAAASGAATRCRDDASNANATDGSTRA